MFSLPNLLSWLRIAISPWTAWLLAQERYAEAVPGVLIVGVTDWLDGYLARRMGQQSRFGEVLDPVADKVSAGMGYAALAWSGLVPTWMFFLVVGRDLLIVLFGGWAMRFRGIDRLPPSLWGKASTFFQFLFVLNRIVQRVAPGWPVLPDGALQWIAASFTVGSGFHYAWVARRLLLKTQ